MDDGADVISMTQIAKRFDARWLMVVMSAAFSLPLQESQARGRFSVILGH